VLTDRGNDAVLVLNCPTAVADSVDAARATVSAAAAHKRPVFTSWLGEEAVTEARRLFAEHRIPTYETPSEAVQAFMHLVCYRRNQEMLRQVPPSIPEAFEPEAKRAKAVLERALGEGRSWLTEVEAKEVLASYGIPVVPTIVVASPDEAARAAGAIGRPVALKVRSSDITHKSDVGGVILGLADPWTVHEAARTMLENVRAARPNARIEGLTVQPMASRLASVGRDFLACSAARGRGTCMNRKSIRRGPLEELVLDGLRQRLMAPELVEEFVAAFHEEMNRLRQDEAVARAGKERELAEVSRKLDGLIDALAEGYRAPGLQQRLDDLAARKAALEGELTAAPPPPVRLHPNLARVYRQQVEQLHEALGDPAIRDEALSILCGLIERVVLHPADDGLQVEILGEIVRMVELGLDAKQAALLEAACSVKVVAGACNHRQFLFPCQSDPGIRSCTESLNLTPSANTFSADSLSVRGSGRWSPGIPPFSGGRLFTAPGRHGPENPL
jgi:hypothetical protein